MIDVSEFNGHIAWSQVPTAYHALVRVTYGTTGIDKLGAVNLAEARATRPAVGAYHFAENGDPANEIAHFLTHFQPRPGGLRGMLDFEPSAYSTPTQARVLAAIETYRHRAGHDPIVYGTASVLAALRLPTSVATCPLMLAGYGPNDGREHPPGPPPAPWKRIAAHQYTSVGDVPGIASQVDLSRIYDAAALFVPKPRIVLGTWRVGYIDRARTETAIVTHTPTIWQRLHPGAKYRGPITITPHRR